MAAWTNTLAQANRFSFAGDYATVWAQTGGEFNAMDSVSQFITLEQGKGYLECRLDSLVTDSMQIAAYMHRGQRYSFEFAQDEWKGSYNLEAHAQERIAPYENNGYPFAVLSMFPEWLNDSTFTVNESIESGPYITFDSLEIVSDKEFSRLYFEQFLRTREGKPYETGA